MFGFKITSTIVLRCVKVEHVLHSMAVIFRCPSIRETRTSIDPNPLFSGQTTRMLIATGCIYFIHTAHTVKRPDSQWTCYSGLIERLLGPLGEAAICQIVLAKANEFVRTSPLDGDRDTRLVWLSDQLKANEFSFELIQGV